MKKTLYSLMLDEEVVREIDRMAHRMGTNRSALINQILADYTSVVTPERRIENIFHEIEQLVAPARDLVPFFAPHTTSMSLKSSLEYKYARRSSTRSRSTATSRRGSASWPSSSAPSRRNCCRA